MFGKARQDQKRPVRRCTTTWSAVSSPRMARNRLWLAGVSEYATREGKLCLCAIKDVFSKRIVGSVDARMRRLLSSEAALVIPVTG